MTKTFCDRCGKECVNTVVNLYGNITETTNQGEELGDGQGIRQVQICRDCLTALREEFGLKLRILPSYSEPVPVPERAVRRDVAGSGGPMPLEESPAEPLVTGQ